MSIKEYLLNLKEKLVFFKKEAGKSAEKILSFLLISSTKSGFGAFKISSIDISLPSLSKPTGSLREIFLLFLDNFKHII